MQLSLNLNWHVVAAGYSVMFYVFWILAMVKEGAIEDPIPGLIATLLPLPMVLWILWTL
jgi:hypothetical protein